MSRATSPSSKWFVLEGGARGWRSGIVLLGLMLSNWAGAQTYAGTKTDPIKTATAQSPTSFGLMPFFQLLVALGIVLLVLKFVLPKFISKLNKRLVTSQEGGIKVEESASFAGGDLYIVNARGKALLLSVATTGVTCLADLTESGRAGESKSRGVEEQDLSTKTFMEVLEEAERVTRVEERAPQ